MNIFLCREKQCRPMVMSIWNQIHLIWVPTPPLTDCNNLDRSDKNFPLVSCLSYKKEDDRGFPGGSVVKTPPAMQATWVQSPIQEDPTYHGATKPMCYNYWAHDLRPESRNPWAHVPQILQPACPRACALQQEEPPQREITGDQLHLLQLEENPHSNRDPAQPGESE